MDKLQDFQEGQWWVKELDAMAQAETATPDQKRAVAVVHNMLRVARSYLGVKVVGTVEFPMQPRVNSYVAFHTVGKPAYEVTNVALVTTAINGSNWIARGLANGAVVEFNPFTGLSDSGLLQVCWVSARIEEERFCHMTTSAIVDAVTNHLLLHANGDTN